MSRRPCLKSISSAAPCSGRWEGMVGTDRVRHCGACGNRAYRLDGLSPGDADAFLAWNEGRPVTRLFARADGSFLVRDCEVGKRQAVERRQQRAQTRWAALALVVVGLLGLAATAPEEAPPSHEATPIAVRGRQTANLRPWRGGEGPRAR